MSARFSTRRAAGIAATSYATLTLLPWAVGWATAGTRSPRAGLLIAAAPLALLFGALAGYAAAPLTTTRTRLRPSPRGTAGPVTPAPPPPTPPAATARAAAAVLSPHPRAGPRPTLLTPAPAAPGPAPDRPAGPPHLTPAPVADPAHHAGPRTSTRHTH